jgi:hypothetical protein
LNTTAHSTVRRWPLALIAAPAAVAVWSGWVGLGTMCGFGLVQPFPGIVAWHLNTAITLPIGVEAYGAYALGAWLTPGTPGRARTFARRSAIGALALGMLGQVVYHLLAAAHAARAPWPVVVLVACLPVVTLGFGAGLTHLLRVPAEPDDERQGDEPAASLAAASDPAPAIAEPEAVELPPVPVGSLPPAPTPAEQADDLATAAAIRPGQPFELEHLRAILEGRAPKEWFADEPGETPAPGVPASNMDAAEMAFRATHAAGNPLSIRKLQDRFGLTRSQATKVRNRVIAKPGDSQADEPGGGAIPADAEPVTDDTPEPVAV